MTFATASLEVSHSDNIVLQLVPSVNLRSYAHTVMSAPRVHTSSSSRTCSERAYQPRGFLAVATLSSRSHLEPIMLYDPVPTSNAPQAVPPAFLLSNYGRCFSILIFLTPPLRPKFEHQLHP